MNIFYHKNDIILSMNKIKSVVRRFNYRLKHGILSVENVVLAIAIVMCLVWTYQSITAMSRNWELIEHLNAEQKALELVKMEVEAAEFENEYYNSDEYKELAARKHAGKQLPGEQMVYLADNSEAAKNKHTQQNREIQDNTEEKDNNSNIEKWIRFLLP